MPAVSRARAALSSSFGTNWTKPFCSRLVPWIASILTWASPRIIPRRASVPGVACTVTLNSTANSPLPRRKLKLIVEESQCHIGYTGSRSRQARLCGGGNGGAWLRGAEASLSRRAFEESRPESHWHYGFALALQGRPVEAMGCSVYEAVERHNILRDQLPVEDDVEQEMHGGTAEIAPQQRPRRPRRDGSQECKQLPRVEREHHPLRTPLKIVAEKGIWTQVSLPIEQNVVDCVIDIDEKPATGDGGCKRQ